ncbi:hypothetical protein SUGI_1051160 [Cryptomeria japonica]|uniref:uncharacterized protein LOC131039413 isoform X2 n=1 Tax=Cryptomeria japonica TaxID=3369 RepID=UPI0024147009|nr:uncharacterized protein LOC131039413 isoform X2 [Cryptomeria japonica]GLJ49560.1 hypothetical protein SUGI_1051160 [Cryptomeria japonica]
MIVLCAPNLFFSWGIRRSLFNAMKDQPCSYDQPLGHSAVVSSPPQHQLRQGQMTQQLAYQGHQQSQSQASQQSQHQLSRQSQTLSGGSSTPPSSNGEPRKISCEDIQQVQNLIERCLQLYMNEREVINTLLNQAKIEPGFTGLVWQKLEEQNPDFFKAYYTRLLVKQQITKFNDLLRQHVELVQKMPATNAPPISNGVHSSPMKHTPIGYHSQQPVISMQRIHNMGCNLVPSNPSLVNGGACLPNTVQSSDDNSISSGRMEISSGVPPMLHGHPGIPPGNDLAIQPGPGFSNNARFSYSGVSNSTDTHGTVMDVSVSDFNSNETHQQSGVGFPQDTNTANQKDPLGFLGQIPRNFSLSDLTADFSHTSDILGSYSGCPFLTPDAEAFLHSPEKECLDDGRMLEPISEHLSYDDFPSDG